MRKLDDSDERIKVYCIYRGDDGEPCICNNREIRAIDMQFFAGEVAPYCRSAIKLMKAKDRAYPIKYQRKDKK